MNLLRLADKMLNYINKTEKFLQQIIIKLNEWKQIISVKISRLYPATKCGHISKQIDVVYVQGKEYYLALQVINNKVAYCHQCLQDTAIICAWCQRPIFVGQPITVLSPKSPNFVVPQGAVIVKETPKKLLVGCTRSTCFDPKHDKAYGFWVMDKDKKTGVIKRKKTSLKTILEGH